jgi:capsular exopolysaccharide synthesis family protein
MKKNNESDQSSTIIRDFFLKVYSLKYFYILCFAGFLAIAFLFNKYSTKVYENNTTISPSEDDRSSILYSNNYFQGLGGYTPGKPIENDITDLRSFALVSSTINSLNLEVGYFSEKNKLFKKRTELYHLTPFYVNIDKSHLQPIDSRFNITLLSDSTFRLSASKKEVTLYNYIDNAVIGENYNLEIDTICRFNKTIDSKLFKFVVSFNKELTNAQIKSTGPIYFEFYNLDFLTKQYLKILNIGPISSSSSIINIRFSGQSYTMVSDFLNKFVDSYLKENLDKKNKIAISTINFIDNQISEISDSLVISESKLRNFKSVNQVTDLSVQGQRLYDQLSQIETERSNLEVQERYYNYILNYFQTNKDMSGIAPPSSMNVADPIMSQLITDLLALNSQRAAILNNKTEKSLFLSQIENKIKMQINAIIENVTNNLNTLNLSINELNYRSNKLSKQISNIPRTEMNMVSMQRKYTLSDAIYTYLLQKRSEAQITLASNYPDYELLEPARLITSQIKKPREKINYLMAIFFAFVIPTAFLILKDFFKDKITSIHDVESLSDQVVLSSIYNNTQKTEAIVSEFPDSSVSESFRNLRSSLLLKLNKEKPKIILLTSSQPQDGKSFISFNIALSIAAVGFKTIIVDCDLRRPTLHKKFNIDNSLGLSNFMLNGAKIDDIKKKTFNDNLTFIPSGPILPNPSELIEGGALDGLINTLKDQYDYVILDTTPIGIVSEAITLMKYASQILLVCRNNYTRKDVLSYAIDSLKSHNIVNYNIVFNDLKMKDSPYKQYNSYYK